MPLHNFHCNIPLQHECIVKDFHKYVLNACLHVPHVDASSLHAGHGVGRSCPDLAAAL